MRFFFWLGAFILLSVISALAQEPELKEVAELKGLFANQKAVGTFVLMDAKTGAVMVHDGKRAQKRFIPASTFKIPNSLIGLETEAIKSVDEVLPYGGKPQFMPEWEHDMGLREAIRISAVPIYQELARRVGLERMREQLKVMQYGNQETGTKVDQFWLKGPLKISAVEQAAFLLRMVRGEFSRSDAHFKAVREITQQEKKGELTLHAKTGWGTVDKPGIGWWVGWIEDDGRVTATFALNMDMPKMSGGKTRILLGRECLAKLAYFPN